MNQIRIKPHYSTILHDADKVEFRQGVWNSMSHILTDENHEGKLAKIIMGLAQQLTPAEIVKEMDVNRSKVESVLDYLMQLGVLQNKPESFIDFYVSYYVPSLKRPGKVFYEVSTPIVLLGNEIINAQIQLQLKKLGLQVETDDQLFALIHHSGDEWLFDALAQEHFISQFERWKNKFIVLSCSHVNPILATRLNRIAYLLNISWLHLALDGPFIFVGPTFRGQQGPCYDCFETRVGMNLRESESYQKYKNAIVKNQIIAPANDIHLDVMGNLLVSHAILEILNYVSTQCTFTTNKTLSIFLPTMEFIYHEILRLPSCRTCGSISHRDNSQLYFDFQSV